LPETAAQVVSRVVDTGLGSSGTNLRARLRDKARRRVLNWVYGVETTFPGDPRRRLIADHTVTADVRLVHAHRDADGASTWPEGATMVRSWLRVRS
jgi:hypothetical protein